MRWATLNATIASAGCWPDAARRGDARVPHRQQRDLLSGFAAWSSRETLPGYGYIGLSLEISPDEADEALAEIEAIAGSLAAGPILAPEVTRITGPRAEAAKRDLASNAFWASALAGAQADPRRLELIRTMGTEYKGITAADVQAAARKWLKPETAWKLKVVPETKKQ